MEPTQTPRCSVSIETDWGQAAPGHSAPRSGGCHGVTSRDVTQEYPRHGSAFHSLLHTPRVPVGTNAETHESRRPVRPVGARRRAALSISRPAAALAWRLPRLVLPSRPTCCSAMAASGRAGGAAPVPAAGAPSPGQLCAPRTTTGCRFACLSAGGRDGGGGGRDGGGAAGLAQLAPCRLDVGRAGRVRWLMSAGAGLEIVNNSPAVTPPPRSGSAEL